MELAQLFRVSVPHRRIDVDQLRCNLLSVWVCNRKVYKRT
jgi:hypothetical protein